jgi:hypothetical protein
LWLTNAQFNSPSGAPNLFYQAGSTQFDFTGRLEETAIIALYIPPFDGFRGYEGARDGLNWFRTVHAATGQVTWTEAVFDLHTIRPPHVGAGFVGITRYVTDRSGVDFTLAQALSFKKDVPEPSTLAIFALGMIGLASRRFKKQS